MIFLSEINNNFNFRFIYASQCHSFWVHFQTSETLKSNSHPLSENEWRLNKWNVPTWNMMILLINVVLYICLHTATDAKKQKQKYKGMFETQKSGNKTSSREILLKIVTPTDRPKSVRNRCVIKVFGGVFYVVTSLFGFFCECKGFCHRTESNLFLFFSTLEHLQVPKWDRTGCSEE